MAKESPGYVKKILFILGDDKRKLPWLILLFIAASILDLIGIGLVAPYIALLIDPELLSQGKFFQLSEFIDVFFPAEDLMLYLSIFVISVFAFKFISAMFINWIILNFCFQQSVKLRSKLMKSYQNLPYIEYINRNSSEYVYNINSLVPQFTLSILQSVLRLISEGVVAISIFALLMWYEPYILLVFISMLIVIIYGYDEFSRKRISEYGCVVNNSSTKMLQGINEGINGLKEVRVLGKEKYFYKRVVENAKKYAEASIKSTILSTAPRYFLEFTIILFISLLVIMIDHLKINTESALLTLSVFGMASIRLMPSSNQILNSFTQIRFGKDTVNRVFSDIKDSKGDLYLREECKDLFKSLKFKGVSFFYPGVKKNILDKMSLEIQANDSIGFIGASGSGKTTLVDMLLGFLTPSEGVIDYNDQPIVENLNKLRMQTAYLPQQTFLIDDTLRRNIALGVENIDNDKIYDSLKRARLIELVKEMPNGLDTILGENGIMISGGQRQRIALARAFYHNRKILIMDEATSALDNETEREISNEVQRLKGKITIIIISHNLSTIKHCDHIYKIEAGKLIKQSDF